MPSDTRLGGRPRTRLVAQVRAEEPNCWLCGNPINLTLNRRSDPWGSVIDEYADEQRTCRANGADPHDRSHTHHAHRWCNGSRGTKPPTMEVRNRCRTAYAEAHGTPIPATHTRDW